MRQGDYKLSNDFERLKTEDVKKLTKKADRNIKSQYLMILAIYVILMFIIASLMKDC